MMYNRYERGSEAYFAMEDAINAVREVESGKDACEEVLERVIGELDDIDCSLKDVIAERDENEEQLDKLQAKYEELHATQPELITLLTNCMVSAESMQKYCQRQLVTLGALNETQDTDCSPGDRSDGSPENTGGKGSGTTTAEGITRPQVP